MHTVRVVLVEDDPDAAEYVRDRLGSWKRHIFLIRCAASLEEVASVLAETECDIILLDLGLPDSTGIRTLKQVRVEAPSVPVVVMTGQREDELGLRALRHGAQDFIEKTGGDGTIARALLYALERHRHSQEVAVAALTDPLTGLPNRALFMDRLDGAIYRASRGGSRFALAYLDFDRFKPVNDLHGHVAGDELLRLIGDRCHGVLRRSDTVARLGGDEFGFILEGVQDASTAMTIMEGVRELLERPYALDTVPDSEPVTVEVGASIGVAIYPEHASEPTRLINVADRAMYEAKRAGGNQVLASPT